MERLIVLHLIEHKTISIDHAAHMAAFYDTEE